MVPGRDMPKASACISTGREETVGSLSMFLLLEGDITAACLSFHRHGPTKRLMMVLFVSTTEALGTNADESKQVVRQRPISRTSG